MKKNIMTAAALIILGAAGAWFYLNLTRQDKLPQPNREEAYCVKHQIAENRERIQVAIGLVREHVRELFPEGVPRQ